MSNFIYVLRLNNKDIWRRATGAQIFCVEAAIARSRVSKVNCLWFIGIDLRKVTPGSINYIPYIGGRVVRPSGFPLSRHIPHKISHHLAAMLSSANGKSKNITYLEDRFRKRTKFTKTFFFTKLTPLLHKLFVSKTTDKHTILTFLKVSL